ncbi:hypothetical protein BgiBS90_015039, partial [Biomphalaria glabrata]
MSFFLNLNCKNTLQHHKVFRATAEIPLGSSVFKAMPKSVSRNRTLFSLMIYCIQCRLYSNSIDTYNDENDTYNNEYLKEAGRLLNATVLLMSNDDVLSCSNRCRQTIPRLYIRDYIHCSCDVRCPVYRSCCEDFQTECPLVHKESLKRFGHMLDLQVDCLELTNTFAIVGCPHQTNYTKKWINQDSFSDVLDNTPVTDVATGLVFANMDIYNCNTLSRSSLARNWTLMALLTNSMPSRHMSKFSHFTMSGPYFTAPIYNHYMSSCNQSSISLCKNSVSLQRQCQSFLPYTLLKNIVSNFSLCKACSVPLSLLSFYDFALEDNSVLILPDMKLLRTSNQPWVEAQCDMSHNVTFSGVGCHIVKCNNRNGFYLQGDNICRQFHLLYIAFHIDPSMFSDGQKEDILNYITFYLTTVLNVNILGTVRPLMSFYNEEIQQNMTVVTFMFDFNSSALEDFFYYTYRDGLSALAAQLRAYAEQLKGTGSSLSNVNVSIRTKAGVGMSFKEFEGYSQRLVLKDLFWCETHTIFCQFYLFGSTDIGHILCFCRLLYSSENEDESCFQLQTCDFQCYGEELSK